MGIFEAEVRGCTGEEDILTSRVFGILEILDRTKFLLPILKQCEINLEQDSKPENLSFSYWEKMTKRTPDVILKDKSTLIFIECKLGSPLDIHQLTEEYEDGMKARKDFWLIAVTSDWTEPSQIQQAKESLTKKSGKEPQLQWINWQKIYAILRSNAKNGSQTEKKLISDLLSLLKVKGLSTFVQFPKEQLSSVVELWPTIPRFLEGCSALFGTLSSRLYEKNIIFEDLIRHGWIASKLEDYNYWMPRWIATRAWDRKWKEGEALLEQWGPLGVGLRQCLITLLYLNPFELIVGYRLGFAGMPNLYQLFVKEAGSCNLAEKLCSFDNYSVTYCDWDLRMQDRKDSQDKEAFKLETPTNAENIIIGHTFNHDEMASPKLLDEVEECLVNMRDIVNENKLYFSKKTIDNFIPQETAETSEAKEEQPSD